MSELFGKLTNLSYEFFGVIMPGIVVNIFLVMLWAAWGPLAPMLSDGALAEFHLSNLSAELVSLSDQKGVAGVIILIIVWYLFGHMLLWVSRSGERTPEKKPGNVMRTWLTLRLTIPRPEHSFEQKLAPVFDEIKKRFEVGALQLEWRHFYPIAKNFLFQRTTYSLVATYQHKYTLHRSIACLAAISFWAFGASIVAGLGICFWCGPSPSPNWWLLGLGFLGSLFLAWGFSGSYVDNWLMFGNTIITECYALVIGPDTNAGSKKSRSD